jgi:hypothetical protein
MPTTIWTTPGDVQKVVETLRSQRGEFSLAMLYNEDGQSSTGWNLIVSAPWTDALKLPEATGIVVRALSEGLGLENKHAISRVTVLPTSDRFVREIASFYQITSPSSGQWIRDVSVAGIPIGAAFIFYSRTD